ncbi:MAG: hypothetical protein U5K79_15825 [Cyclobacteriaceae bacterium]|nr:hypothetical protein [Cyclobacteriaceae bacterium]
MAILKLTTLSEMVGHIYGKTNVIERTDRPHMFVKELSLYVDYLRNRVNEMAKPITDKNQKYVETFQKNLHDGIEYYKDLFQHKADAFHEKKAQIIQSLDKLKYDLDDVVLKVFGVLQ